MKIDEIMERVGSTKPGVVVAYVKDALEEMALISPTHITKERIDITLDQRLYEIPLDALNILDIRCKHHNNEDSTYRSIPRLAYEPEIEDTDGI